MKKLDLEEVGLFLCLNESDYIVVSLKGLKVPKVCLIAFIFV